MTYEGYACRHEHIFETLNRFTAEKGRALQR